VISPSTKKVNVLDFGNGFGWHDKTRSDRPQQSVVKNRVFGRASNGSGTFDSINWFQGEDYTGKAHTSAYIARKGKAFPTACETVGNRGQESWSRSRQVR